MATKDGIIKDFFEKKKTALLVDIMDNGLLFEFFRNREVVRRWKVELETLLLSDV